MGKVSVSYKKILPGERDFCSEQFFGLLEVELPDQILFDYPMLQLKMRQLFEEIKTGVETQAKKVQPKEVEKPKQVQPARTYTAVPVKKDTPTNDKLWTNRANSHEQVEQKA